MNHRIESNSKNYSFTRPLVAASGRYPSALSEVDDAVAPLAQSVAFPGGFVSDGSFLLALSDRGGVTDAAALPGVVAAAECLPVEDLSRDDKMDLFSVGYILVAIALFVYYTK